MQIRKARVSDARAIHEAHMRSIRELCAADYTAEQIGAWSGRDFDEQRRVDAIVNDQVWVIEDGGRILGYGHLRRAADEAVAFLEALYFAPEAAGRGLGREMLQAIESQARAWGCRVLRLNGTRTARGFYLRQGFRPAGAEFQYPCNGCEIPCTPFEKAL